MWCGRQCGGGWSGGRGWGNSLQARCLRHRRAGRAFELRRGLIGDAQDTKYRFDLLLSSPLFISSLSVDSCSQPFLQIPTIFIRQSSPSLTNGLTNLVVDFGDVRQGSQKFHNAFTQPPSAGCDQHISCDSRGNLPRLSNCPWSLCCLPLPLLNYRPIGAVIETRSTVTLSVWHGPGVGLSQEPLRDGLRAEPLDDRASCFLPNLPLPVDPLCVLNN